MPSLEFSPSATKNWSRCPVLWKLQNIEKWVPRAIGYKEIAALCGNVFGKGMEVYNLAVKAEGYERVRTDKPYAEALLADVLGHARAHAAAEAKKLVEQGHAIENLDDADAKIELTLKALAKYIPLDSTPSDWLVIGVEQTLQDHGWCRCDVLYQTPDRKRVVRDYKFKLKLENWRRADVLAEYGESAQMLHYLYAYEADVFEVALVTKAPWYAEVILFAKDPDRLDSWLASQQTKWGQMQRMKEGLAEPWESDEHSDKYGACAYHEACLTYNRDPERMRLGGFIQIGRR